MIRLFSKRHEKAIFEKRLRVSLPRRLRKRMWSVLTRQDFSFHYQPDPEDNWTERTSTLEQIPGELCHRYGVDQLVAFGDADQRVRVDLKGFVEQGYPAQVLDVVELFYAEFPSERRLNFQREINFVLEEESSEWRLADGQFFKVDSEFLNIQVVARTYELLKAEGFEGALDEFNQARNELAANNPKGAIHNACKCFESVLKAILDQDQGNAATLVRKLGEKGFYDDIPEDVGKAFGEQVLMALPFLRNRLGGHGQGPSVVDVPPLYGELAIHLAGTLVLFTVRRSMQLLEKQKQQKESQTEGDRRSG